MPNLITVTVWLAWAFVIGIAVTDIVLIVIGNRMRQNDPSAPPARSSYSEQIRAASAQHLELPFATGAIGGHWFGPALGMPDWTPLVLIAVAGILSLLGWFHVWPEASKARPAWPRMTAALLAGTFAGGLLWSQAPAHVIADDIETHRMNGGSNYGD